MASERGLWVDDGPARAVERDITVEVEKGGGGGVGDSGEIIGGGGGTNDVTTDSL